MSTETEASDREIVNSPRIIEIVEAEVEVEVVRIQDLNVRFASATGSHTDSMSEFLIKAGGSVAGGALLGEALGGPVGAVVGGIIGVAGAALSTYGRESKESHR